MVFAETNVGSVRGQQVVIVFVEEVEFAVQFVYHCIALSVPF